MEEELLYVQKKQWKLGDLRMGRQARLNRENMLEWGKGWKQVSQSRGTPHSRVTCWSGPREHRIPT